MNRNRSLKLVVFAAFVLMIAALFATWRVVAAPWSDVDASRSGGAANAVALAPNATPTAVPGGPAFYSMSSFGFSMEEESDKFALCREGPELYSCSAFLPATVAAPVPLPNGAAVTKVVSYFFDHSTLH